MIFNTLTRTEIITIVIVSVLLLFFIFMLVSKNFLENKSTIDLNEKKNSQNKSEEKKINFIKEDIKILFFEILKLMDEFKPSVGRYTMGDIQLIKKDKINTLVNTSLYQEVILLENAKEIIEIINDFETISLGKWKKFLTIKVNTL